MEGLVILAGDLVILLGGPVLSATDSLKGYEGLYL